jgi:plasmid stability protein
MDEPTKAKLRVRAATHGRSMEEEERAILKTELEKKSSHTYNLAESIRRHVAPLGGVNSSSSRVKHPAQAAGIEKLRGETSDAHALAFAT